LVGSVILTEAALSYLGLGIQPPTPSWGNMLQDAQNFTIMLKAWWYPLSPGLMILLTVLCFNFVGDGLRDALDPKINE
jgi:peptide/nickel transport system permease protein